MVLPLIFAEKHWKTNKKMKWLIGDVKHKISWGRAHYKGSPRVVHQILWGCMPLFWSNDGWHMGHTTLIWTFLCLIYCWVGHRLEPYRLRWRCEGGRGSHSGLLTMFSLLRWLGGQLNGLLWFAQVEGVVLPKANYQGGVIPRGGGMGSSTL